jgi:hypothetical protein
VKVLESNKVDLAIIDMGGSKDFNPNVAVKKSVKKRGLS